MRCFFRLSCIKTQADPEFFYLYAKKLQIPLAISARIMYYGITA